MIFSEGEIKRRLESLMKAMEELNLGGVILHSADSVYYFSGIPLLDEWGRPMWFLLKRDGSRALVASIIEYENMRTAANVDGIRIYEDTRSSLPQCVDVAVDFFRTTVNRKFGIERSVLPLGAWEALREALPAAEFVDVSPYVAQARLVKSEEEIAVMRLAGDVAKIGANAFLNALHPGVTETAVAAAATGAVDQAIGALGPDYMSSSFSYCQFGQRTLSPHLKPSGRRAKQGDVVGLNVFPVVSGYLIELERTVIIGEGTTEQEAALAAVTRAFAAAKAHYRPGVELRDVNRCGLDVLTSHGYKIGATNGAKHGAGHACGILIGSSGREELGEVRPYNPTTVAEGMINAIEPGIYLHDLGAAFRHSDVLLATPNGSECLTDFPVTFRL